MYFELVRSYTVQFSFNFIHEFHEMIYKGTAWANSESNLNDFVIKIHRTSSWNFWLLITVRYACTVIKHEIDTVNLYLQHPRCFHTQVSRVPWYHLNFHWLVHFCNYNIYTSIAMKKQQKLEILNFSSPFM